MKKIFSLLLLAVLTIVPFNTQAAAFPGESDLTFNGVYTSCQSCLQVGVNLQQVYKFRLTNTSESDIGVEQINLRVSGNTTASDLTRIRFFDDPNSELLGVADIDYDLNLVTLEASPIITIPAGEVREVTAYANVKSTAVVGRKIQFSAQPGDVIDSGGNSVFNTLPYYGKQMSICNPQVLAGDPVITVINPNGGDILTKGEMYTMYWRTENAPWVSYVRNVELIRAGEVVKVINVISTPPTLPGGKLCPSQVVRWVVPDDVPTANNYRIRVRLYRGPTTNPTQIDVDRSDENFRIE